MAKDNYTKAIEAFSQAVKLKNSGAEAQADLGDAYRLSGDFKKAEGSYNVANALPRATRTLARRNRLTYITRPASLSRQCDAYSISNTRCGWQRAVTALEKAVSISHSPWTTRI
jgi:tetratricopeptide (TPR) repeat protein